MPAVDLTQIVAAVDFSTTTVAIMAVAAVLVGVFVVIAASMFVLGLVRGQVFYGGRFWDADVYEAGLRDVKEQARKGKLVDAESRRAVDRFEGREKKRSSSYRIPSMRV
ncbi:MAG: hypothetical protein K8I82_01295 [Anaerolineae bacterium]|nr:hypothetical protein [Anaerolineae bacterium]